MVLLVPSPNISKNDDKMLLLLIDITETDKTAEQFC